MSSGAIALGRRHLGLSAGKLKLEESQAAAAVGQIRLAHAYKELLEAHDITVAQILLTLGDTEQRRRYLNARGTLNTLLSLGAVPVINENDTVATAEIRYGDNDRLAARVAQMAAPIAWCCYRTSMASTRRIRRMIRTRISYPVCSTSPRPSRRWRAASKQRLGDRRHADQNRRRENRRGRRVPSVHRQGGAAASAEANRGGRALHVVRAVLHARRPRASNGSPAP